MPVQHVRVVREEMLHRRKCLAQLVEQLAQVIASLGLGCIGPEEESKMLALLGNIAMQHEIGEQGVQARSVEACHLLVIVEQAEIAEQADVKVGTIMICSISPVQAQAMTGEAEWPALETCV